MKHIQTYEKLRKDKIVICINNDNGLNDVLTIGKKYKITRVIGPFIYVINDQNEEGNFFKNRFTTELKYIASKYNI